MDNKSDIKVGKTTNFDIQENLQFENYPKEENLYWGMFTVYFVASEQNFSPLYSDQPLLGQEDVLEIPSTKKFKGFHKKHSDYS